MLTHAEPYIMLLSHFSLAAAGSNEMQKQKLYNSAVKFLKFGVMEPIHAQKNNL